MKELVGKRLGRYQLLALLGEGGMAAVFRARHIRSRKTVAVKVLSPYVAKEATFRARFVRELRVLQRLRHPNIVPVLDHGQVGAYLFIVMPYMQAGTLGERMRGGALPLPLAQQVITQIAEALEYAHGKGVVHRDIKPSNILIDDRGRALLADFGFARLEDTSNSLTGSALIGTPSYMSPEQCRGEPATPKSDQYALGVVAYQMTTGALPFVADSPMAVVMMHATQPLPPPRQKCPDLPRNVEAVLMRALEKDPARRFPSVMAFAWALSQAVRYPDHSPAGVAAPLAGPDDATQNMPGLAARLRSAFGGRRVRRRLVLLALLALLLVCLPTGYLAGAGWLRDNSLATATPNGAPAAQLLATIEALSTANARSMGLDPAPGMVETAVQATLSALLASEKSVGAARQGGDMPAGASGATPAAGDGSGVRPTPTPPPPTATAAGMAGNEPGASPSPAMTATDSATPTPSMTVTPTASQPVASETPTPTFTLTSTPTPIPEEKCKGPDHPRYPCTPTPTEEDD